jgi:hypothetical protein
VVAMHFFFCGFVWLFVFGVCFVFVLLFWLCGCGCAFGRVYGLLSVSGLCFWVLIEDGWVVDLRKLFLGFLF